jgi:hypothetical protein
LESARHIHENVYLANVSPINVLNPGHFVIVLRPGKMIKEVVLGEGKNPALA